MAHIRCSVFIAAPTSAKWSTHAACEALLQAMQSGEALLLPFETLSGVKVGRNGTRFAASDELPELQKRLYDSSELSDALSDGLSEAAWATTFSARSPLSPSTTSKVTGSPSARVLYPSPEILE
jgi:hypothetical protein